MKREIPLFVLDTNRTHKMGECDFITCTDVNSGFIAKIDYIDQNDNYVDDNTRIECKDGVGCRMQVKRVIGLKPDKGDVRTLMKQAFEYFRKSVQFQVNVDEPSTEDCIKYIDAIIVSNKQYIDECGSDYNKRKTVASSIMIMEVVKRKLMESLK